MRKPTKKSVPQKSKKNKKIAEPIIAPVVEAIMHKIKKLEERMDKLELMFATMIRMANPVAQPRVSAKSGVKPLRSGNVYQSVAFPGSPNAEEAQTPEPTPTGTAVDPRGTVRPPR
jgi:hypothetical protein